MLLNSRFVALICSAGVMVNKFCHVCQSMRSRQCSQPMRGKKWRGPTKPLISYWRLPMPWKFQYHKILVQPATRTSIVSISMIPGAFSTPLMYRSLPTKVAVPSCPNKWQRVSPIAHVAKFSCLPVALRETRSNHWSLCSRDPGGFGQWRWRRLGRYEPRWKCICRLSVITLNHDEEGGQLSND
jgi:hypothetical protein